MVEKFVSPDSLLWAIRTLRDRNLPEYKIAGDFLLLKFMQAQNEIAKIELKRNSFIDESLRLLDFFSLKFIACLKQTIFIF